jgi:hypothetical protein
MHAIDCSASRLIFAGTNSGQTSGGNEVNWRYAVLVRRKFSCDWKYCLFPYSRGLPTYLVMFRLVGLVSFQFTLICSSVLFCLLFSRWREQSARREYSALHWGEGKPDQADHWDHRQRPGTTGGSGVLVSVSVSVSVLVLMLVLVWC